MNILFPIISFPYASRVLLPNGIGAVNFANSIIEYFIMIAGLGITTYAAREAAKIRDDKYALTKFTREILAFNFITTFIAYFVLLPCLFLFSFFSSYKLLLIVCSTKILFSTIGINWFYTANEEYAYITLRHTIFQLLSLILLFSLVKDESDYIIYAGIGIFSNVGANIFNFLYVRKYINIFEKTRIELKRHIKPILTFFATDAAGKINSTLDTAMLGFLAGNVSVGLYSAATKLSQMIRELITSIIATFMPRSSYLIENCKSEEYETLINKALGVTFFLSFPATMGLFFLATPLTVIFCGENYLNSVPTMKLLSFCIILMSLNSYINNLILTPNRLEKFMLYAQIIALIINASLNWLFIKYGMKYGVQWGVFGAGIATLLVDLTLPMTKLFVGWKYINSKENFFSLLKTIVGTIIMFISLELIFSQISSNILKIVMSTISGTIIYFIVELLIKHPAALMVLKTVKKYRGKNTLSRNRQDEGES